MLAGARRDPRVPLVVHPHGDQVEPGFRERRDVDAEAGVAADVPAGALAVDEDLGVLEDAVELQRDTPGRDGRGILFIENKFPITEPEQGEASFFPWYSLAVFALVLSPLLALLQWLFPSFPWFLAGFAALAVSLTLYEVLHAINHWPFEKWEPLIQHPRWGWYWRPAYAFHLRHHAVIDCNESISGFFGLPVADWAFGTCVIPQTVYAEGEEWTPDKFRSPRPRWIIRAISSFPVPLSP